MDLLPQVVKIGQLAKKLRWKEKWLDSRLLASFGTYHQTGENSRYDPNIRTATSGGNCAEI
jgi:hypothetical protein